MDILILVLANFALTTALTESNGPAGVFYKLRQLKGTAMLECFLCTSVLLGAVLALYIAVNPVEWVILSFATAGGATFLNAITEIDL